jgi:hypothetical protein
MESKKNLQINDYFEIFILCFSVSHGAIEHLISFLCFHISKCITERVGGRAFSGGAGSSICAGNWQYVFTMAFRSAESNTQRT